MKLVLLGPPGAGKGTLANLLKQSLKLVHISTGDILREEIKNSSKLGLEVKKYLDGGQLVPDELVTKLIENKFATDSNVKKGYMLDGYPRTTAQAEDLDKILEKVNLPVDYALCLESAPELLIKRLTGRRVCKACGATYHATNRPPKKKDICDNCGGELYQRADDKEETIRTRLDVYTKSTAPIIDFYAKQGKLKKLDGNRDSEELQKVLMNEFHEDGRRN